MVKVTLGGNEYDVFTDVASADLYLAGDVTRAAAWALREPEAKMRGLISATRMLLALPWCDGAPAFDAVPPVVAEVTAMLAADLLAKPKLFADASGNSNIKSVKAGSAQVEFFSPVDGGPPLPVALWNLLNNAGLMCLGLGSATVNDAAYFSGTSGGCRPLGGRYPWDWPIAAGDYD
jgi:hypothetical protein